MSYDRDNVSALAVAAVLVALIAGVFGSIVNYHRGAERTDQLRALMGCPVPAERAP